MPIARAQDTCSVCPKLCRHLCPVAEASKRESDTPWGKQRLARMIRRGEVALSPHTAQPSYHCVMCGAHHDWCRLDVDGRPSLLQLRRRAVRESLAPASVAETLAALRRDLPPPSDLGVPGRSPDGRQVLLCESEWSLLDPEWLRAWRQRLARHAPDTVLLDHPGGLVAHWLGDEELAEDSRRGLRRALAGAREVWVEAPETRAWLADAVANLREPPWMAPIADAAHESVNGAARLIVDDLRAPERVRLWRSLAARLRVTMLGMDRLGEALHPGLGGGLPFSAPKLAAEMARRIHDRAAAAGASGIWCSDLLTARVLSRHGPLSVEALVDLRGPDPASA